MINYINRGNSKNISGIMKLAGYYFADMLPVYDGSRITERILPWGYK
jgi:hypothetical protein